MSRLDLSDAADRRRFCEIQYRGFSALGAACNWSAAEATTALDRLHRTLAEELGRPAERPRIAPAQALHPDAVAYVTLGSQLGTEAMRRSLAEADRHGLFGQEPDRDAWRAFRQRLEAMPADDRRARRILADADAAFGIFLQASGAAPDTKNETDPT